MLRAAGTGPELLRLAVAETNRARSDELLHRAAQAWPSPPVAEEIRRRLAEPPPEWRRGDLLENSPVLLVPGVPRVQTSMALVNATAEIAARAPAGSYEWALE